MTDVWYSPGSWLALSGPALHALAEVQPESPVLAEWARTTEAGGGSDDVLGILMRHGLGVAPSFAFVEVLPTGVRVVLRGDARVWCADGRELSADGAPTWRDGIIGLDALPLRMTGPQPPTVATRLPLGRGVVFAATVDVYLGTAEAVPAAQAPAAVPAPAPNVPLVPDPPVTMPAPPTPTPVAPTVVSAPPDPAPPAPDPVVAEATTAETTGADDYAHLFGPTIAPPAVPQVTGSPTSGAGSADDTLFTRPEAVEPVDVPAPPDTAVTPTPEPAPRAVVVPDDGVISAFPWEGAGDPGGAGAPEEVTPTPVPTGGSTVDATWGHPQEVPVAAPPPTTTATPGPTPGGGETGDHTVARSALPPTPAPVGPTVLAAYCPVGHLSPVHAQSCRVCDRPIAPHQQPMTIARPTLGLLRLPGGQSIPLDRSVLLGRAPVPHDAPAGEQPHAVSLASPEKDISRNHVEIRLDGWHVLAVDLGSVNGTVVVLPGRPPQRLRPEEPVILERGADVVLADEVTVTFEVHG